MPIGSKKEIDIFIQDQDSALFQFFMMTEEKTDISLISPVAVDDIIINVSPGHGFSVNDYLVLWENSGFEQVKVVAVNTNALTIDIPMANAFTLVAVGIRGSIEMNVNGSGTPVDFCFRFFNNAVVPIDISAINITLQHAVAPDDSKFGGLSALAKGLFFRKTNSAGALNYGVYKSNQDFRDRGGEVIYTDKGPAGINATNVKLAVRDSFGQSTVIRVNPRINDCLFACVRDDIDVGSGLAKFTTSLLGSYTRGE